MMWVMAHATLRTFFMMCFMSPHVNVGKLCTGVEMRVETTSWEKWQRHDQDWRPWRHIHQYKKVSCSLPGKIPLHIDIEFLKTTHLVFVTSCKCP